MLNRVDSNACASLTKSRVFVNGLLFRDLESVGLGGSQLILSLTRHLELYTLDVCYSMGSSQVKK